MRARVSSSRSVLVAIGALLVVASACERPPPPVRSTPTTTVGKDGSPAPVPITVTQVLGGDAGPTPVPPAPAPGPSASGSPPPAGPKLCGCALCEPLPSDDACTTDADCAPSTPCHATACVAKAKAEPRKPGTMCTEIMMCGTFDANACGCVKGKCALHPK